EPQPPEGATLAPRLKRTDGYLDWQRPARELVNVVRGCNPWPGALTKSRAGALTIWRATAAGAGPTDPPGTVIRPRPDGDEVAGARGRRESARACGGGRELRRPRAGGRAAGARAVVPRRGTGDGARVWNAPLAALSRLDSGAPLTAGPRRARPPGPGDLANGR